MRKTEEKEVVKKSLEKVTTERICDFCGKAILPVDGERYDYYRLTTSPCDWGNDYTDSVEHFDACSVGCALGLAEKYLKSTIGWCDYVDFHIETTVQDGRLKYDGTRRKSKRMDEP